MRQLSAAGQQTINDVATRHGFSPDAVLSMLDSVINGNGAMAQFSHPEFGGSGQWMRGGMIMVSDMFNNYLKGRIDGLCNELAGLVASEPDLIVSGSFQSQSQGGQRQGGFGGGQQQQQGGTGPVGAASLFVPPAPGRSVHWWPEGLGQPNSTGAQNDVRYAYFAQPRRLAIDLNGRVTVYDTLDHLIGGFSQQQSYGGSLTFSSQYGLVEVANLPVVSVDGLPQAAPAPEPIAVHQPTSAPAPTSSPVSQPVPGPELSPVQPSSVGIPPVGSEANIFATIEKLAELRGKGILSEEEFAAKKTELLSRL